MLSARERRSVVPALFVSGVAVLALVASLSPAQTRLAMEQDGMAMGSGGLPLAMGDDDANGPAAQPTSNSFLDAIESSVTAARAVRQALGGPSMRVAAGRFLFAILQLSDNQASICYWHHNQEGEDFSPPPPPPHSRKFRFHLGSELLSRFCQLD